MRSGRGVLLDGVAVAVALAVWVVVVAGGGEKAGVVDLTQLCTRGFFFLDGLAELAGL